MMLSIKNFTNIAKKYVYTMNNIITNHQICVNLFLYSKNKHKF